MITLYTWTTPNGYKPAIALEELGLTYDVRAVSLSRKEQKDPAYVALNPNAKIPTLVDDAGPGGAPLTIFESGAILYYLAEKSGALLPKDLRARVKALEWLMFQVAHVGPAFGQTKHFRMDAPEEARTGYAAERFAAEAKRVYGVLDARLGEAPFLADEYSIADIATWPWVRNYEKHGIVLAEFPHLKKWFDAIAARPAVKAALGKVDGAASRRQEEASK